MNNINLELLAVDGKARVNKVKINKHEFNTPIFMPVATRGSIKSVNLEELSDTKIILGNTYHLYLRPGLEIIKDFGGLHEYINWDQLILTDSGGFQGWSIPNSQTDDGILFKNIYDGTKFLMTPELSIHIQETLNSNIAMILDQLIDINASKVMQKQAIINTNIWAKKAREIHNNKNQSLFGIIQGGKYKDLREISTKNMLENDFNGYAIGGLAIGETEKERNEIVSFTTDLLPVDKLRYVMGVGDIKSLINLIELGVDMFDCVWPARIARHGKIINRAKYFNLKNSKYKNIKDPLVKDCNCNTCLNFSTSYMRHLLINEPTSSWQFLTIHNIYQTQNIINEVRESILNSDFDNYKEKLLNE